MNSAAIAFAYEPPNGAATRIERGGSHRITSPDRARLNALVNAALEFKIAPNARLVVLDAEPQTLDRTARAALRSRIGFLPANGGLISNLNGWENAALPLGFHQPQRLPDIALPLLRLLDTLVGGARALLAKLPEDMTVLERKAIGFARALLLAPELLIVEDFARGLEPAERPRIDDFIAAYHEACAGGTLLQIDHHVSS